MSTARDAASNRWRGRLVVAGGVLALLLAGAGLVVWQLQRAVPELVERRLSEALRAKVRIGAVDTDLFAGGSGRVHVLRRVRITDVRDLPVIGSLVAERIDVEAGLAELRSGGFGRATVHGAELRLVVRCDELLPDQIQRYRNAGAERTPAAPAPPVSTLLFEDARVLLESPLRSTELRASGAIRVVGGNLEGEVASTAEGAELGPVAALFAPDLVADCSPEDPVAVRGLAARSLRASLGLEAGGVVRLDAGVDRLTVSGPAGALSEEGVALDLRSAGALAATYDSAATEASLARDADPSAPWRVDGRTTAPLSWLLAWQTLEARGGSTDGVVAFRARVDEAGLRAIAETDDLILRLASGSLPEAIRLTDARVELEPETTGGDRPVALRADVRSVGATPAGLSPALLRGSFEAKGLWSAEALHGEARVSRTDGLLELDGVWSFDEERLAADWRFRGRPPEELWKRFVEDRLPSGFGLGRAPRVLGSGRVAVALDRLLANGAGLDLRYRLATERLAGRLGADEGRAGSDSGNEPLAVFMLEQTTLDGRLQRLPETRVEARLKGDLLATGSILPGLETVRADLDATVALLDGRLLPAELRLATAELGELQATTEVCTLPCLPDGELRLRGLSAPTWWRRLGLEVEALREASFSGDLEVDGRWRAAEGSRELELEGLVRGSDLGVQSGAGDRVLLGMATALGFTGGVHLEPGPPRLRWDASGWIGGFQALWGTAYGDFRERRAPVLATGRMLLDGERPITVALLVGERDGNRVEARLETTDGDRPTRLRLEAELPRLEEAWAAAVVDPWSTALPLLGSSRPTGALRTLLELSTGGSTASLTGDVSWTNGSIRVGTDPEGPGLAVSGLQLSAPLDLRAPWPLQEPLIVTGPVRQGRVRFSGARLGELEIGPYGSELELEGDTVRFEESLESDLFGGRLVLDRVELADLVSDGRELRARAGLQALSLEAVAERFGLPPLRGTLDSSIPELRLDGRGTLQIDGRGDVQVLGGTAVIEELEVANLFTDFPKTSTSVSFEGIDLERLSARFELGEVSGRIAGRIEDVVLIGGSPVRFSGTARSVATPGVKQRISLRAVDNLTEIAAGSEVPWRGLPAFLRRFPYQGLGIEVALTDDRFLMRGLERRGDKELFVKGSLPIRLDVVNVHPGSTVSFRTMMTRLQNVAVRGRGEAPPTTAPPPVTESGAGAGRSSEGSLP